MRGFVTTVVSECVSAEATRPALMSAARDSGSSSLGFFVFTSPDRRARENMRGIDAIFGRLGENSDGAADGDDLAVLRVKNEATLDPGGDGGGGASDMLLRRQRASGAGRDEFEARAMRGTLGGRPTGRGTVGGGRGLHFLSYGARSSGGTAGRVRCGSNCGGPGGTVGEVASRRTKFTVITITLWAPGGRRLGVGVQ